MNVLITGNLGYLGTVMSAQFRSAGHQVTGLDTGYFEHCVLGEESPADPPTMRLDIRDIKASHLEGFDAVIHLAALSNDPLGNLAAEVTYDINLHASVALAQAAKAAGVPRFLYASTCSVYGASSTELVTEEAALDPLTPYAISKVRVETELERLADETFSPVFLRNATAFGHSPRLRGDIVVNNLVAYAMLRGEIRVLSDGTPWRPLVHARDIADAFLAAAGSNRADTNCAAINIGHERNNLTVAEIAEIIAEMIPSATVNITGETGPDPRSYRVSFARQRQLLNGFSPRWSIRDGVAELRDHYLTAGLTWDQFTRNFIRLKHLQSLREKGVLDPDLRWRPSEVR